MKITTTLLFALAAILISGCSTTVNTVERADPVGIPNAVPDRRVVTDKSLGEKLSILQVNEGVVSGNLVKIQVMLQNNKSKPVNVSYAFDWFDTSGMMVRTSSSGWKSLRMMGKESKVVSAVAPNPQAVDFVLKLQEPTVK